MKNFLSFFSTLLLATLILAPGAARAEQFKIAIMQDQSGEAQKYKPLLDYLAKKGVEASFVTTRDYPAAAQMFAGGEVDAMFSGSGIAGTMILKGLADPLVRPVGKDGNSTYWAVVIAKKGAPKFNGKADYFKGKKVLYTALASSGEFYFRSIPGATAAGAEMATAGSHGAALEALDRGLADIAVVKNRVWDKNKSKFANLEEIGADKGENPDNTLIVSKKVAAATKDKVSAALLSVEGDSSAEASAVKESLGIQGYKKTSAKDFEHTLPLLKKAGVTPAFNFKY